MSAFGWYLAGNNWLAAVSMSKCTHHGNGAEKSRVVRVDGQCFLEVKLSQDKLLLFIVHHADAVPSQKHRPTNTEHC